VRRLLGSALLVLVVSACGSPAPAPTAEYDVVAEALKAFDRSDWAQAARLLREATAKQPSDVRLHYSLAVAATHLTLREEAIREFQWVVANGVPGSPEVVAARNWLNAAGVAVAEASAGGDTDRTAGNGARDPDRGDNVVRGRVTWPDGEPPVKLTRLQLFLKGIGGTPTENVYLVLRTDEEARFEFKDVPPGEYKLTNRIAGEPLWRLRVKVAEGQEASLDLSPQNSLRVRDDFPQDGK
jgi:hypothetical protein